MPLTVKKALQKVPGVSKIETLYEKKQVVVTFDDSKTTTDALVKATTNAGYPSQPEKSGKESGFHRESEPAAIGERLQLEEVWSSHDRLLLSER